MAVTSSQVKKLPFSGSAFRTLAKSGQVPTTVAWKFVLPLRIWNRSWATGATPTTSSAKASWMA